MTQIEDSPLLARVIETLNDNYPNDDMLSQAYEMLLEDEPYDIDDTLAVFVVREVAGIVDPQRHNLRTAIKAASNHFLTIIEDLQALRKSIN